MKEIYQEYCMRFTNEELEEYMIGYLVDHSWERESIRFLSENGNEIDTDSSDTIGTIVFDKEENLFINFYGIHTSIFAYDEEIMFIDEDSKGIYTSSDVYGNVVYEGKLREMTHEQMLKMFSHIILCFADATEVHVCRSNIADNKYKKNGYYEPYMYTIDIDNKSKLKEVCMYENITINY